MTEQATTGNEQATTSKAKPTPLASGYQVWQNLKANKGRFVGGHAEHAHYLVVDGKTFRVNEEVADEAKAIAKEMGKNYDGAFKGIQLPSGKGHKKAINLNPAPYANADTGYLFVSVGKYFDLPVKLIPRTGKTERKGYEQVKFRVVYAEGDKKSVTITLDDVTGK